MTEAHRVAPYLDDLLCTIDAFVQAFAVCKVDRNAQLRLGPLDAPLVHYVLRGKGAVTLKNGVAPLGSGALAIIPAKVQHRLCVTGTHGRIVDGMDGAVARQDGLLQINATEGTPELVTACATITARYWSTLGFFDRLDEPLVFEGDQIDGLGDLFGEMLDELEAARLGAQAIASALLKKAIVLVVRTEMTRERGAAWLFGMHSPQLGRAVAALLESDDLSVDQLADIAGMSRSAFTRQFQKSFGQTVVEFQTATRMRRAALLLVNTALPVAMVGAAVGYESRSHFTRTFRRSFGTDPTSFRKHGGERTVTDHVKNLFRV